MSVLQPLSTLRKTQAGGRIRIQVIRKWKKNYSHYAPEQHLIVADDAGDRMYCTIRAHDRPRFCNTFKEGKWYEISNFEVNTRGDEAKFSRSPFHIYFNPNTTFEPTPEFNNICRRYSPVEIPSVKNGTIYQSYNVVDLMGVIVDVYEMEVYPEYERPYDDIPELKIIRFIVQDFDGNRIQCVAKDQMADRFLAEWLTTMSSWPHIILLRFWDIVNLPVDYGLEASKCYSDFMIEPDIPIVEQARDTLHGSDKFQFSYDFYRRAPGRPQPLF